MKRKGYTHTRESKEKRQSRPVFYVSDRAHPVRGLLPEEIAAFHASVNAIRQRALAAQAVKTLRPRTLYAGTACRPALR